MNIRPKYIPVLWSSVLFLLCFALMFLVVARLSTFIETSQISVPSVSGAAGGVPGGAGLENIGEAITVDSTGMPILYFFLIAALLGVALYFVPIAKLWLLLRVLFGFGFAWGVFIFAAYFIHTIAAAVLAAAAGLIWLLFAWIWFHNILLVLTLVSLGTVFGAMFSPWTVILIMFVIAVYDLLAVKFGYMQWMAGKLSDAEALPAFFIPYRLANFRMSLKGSLVKNIFNDPDSKQFSVLGGGDIFFPLWLAATAWFASDIKMASVVAAFSFAGLLSTYLIHFYLLKGRATPALPPIFLFSLCGLLLVTFGLSG